MRPERTVLQFDDRQLRPAVAESTSNLTHWQFVWLQRITVHARSESQSFAEQLVRGNAHIARADAPAVIPILSEVPGLFGTWNPERVRERTHRARARSPRPV